MCDSQTLPREAWYFHDDKKWRRVTIHAWSTSEDGYTLLRPVAVIEDQESGALGYTDVTRIRFAMPPLVDEIYSSTPNPPERLSAPVADE